MNSKFHAAVHQRDEVTYVKLGGVIDEDNELADLTERISAGTVVIDLGEIERINSCGVRDWVNWLTKVEKAGGRVVLVECSPAIVSQINLVNNFTGSGVVKSFFAPYFCPNCEREKVLLIESRELGHGPHRAPTCRCDECDGVMDFDDMEDSYFAFLSSAKKVAESTQDRKIAAVVTELHQADAEKSKIRSRVGSSSGIAVSSGGGLSLNASSLPSVPSLPSLARGSSGPSGSYGVQSAASLALASGPARTFAGSGSRPGQLTNPGSDPGPRSQGLGAVHEGPRFGASVTDNRWAPRSGKMVYVLVAVLIMAICVLAVLLFSGGGAPAASGKRGALDPAPGAATITER
jgi:anti-anti-sigma regulatory factor